jgi:hypothetical protein
MTGTDLRTNTEDAQGVSYYVTSGGERIAGPFGSKEYAQTVGERMETKQGYSKTSLVGEMA